MGYMRIGCPSTAMVEDWLMSAYLANQLIHRLLVVVEKAMVMGANGPIVVNAAALPILMNSLAH